MDRVAGLVHGEAYIIAGAYCEPMPRPTPPILIGGGGEQLTLRIVARYADWWNLPGGSVETYARKLDILAGYCDAIGRDPATIVKTWETGCVAVADSAEEARRLAEVSPFYHQGGPEASVVGTPAMVAEHLDRYRALGVSHLILRFADFPRLDGVLRFAEEVAPVLRRGG
ncbi:MAG: LLM class flavin-dependent oxidoreductase [Chloroflexi bacterium]|nr:LLM class flavin-dependent oxidoreductase [Chloroflexota bacterium]